MGLFDQIKDFMKSDRVQKLAGKADEAAGKVGAAVDSKTGGAATRASEFLNKTGSQLAGRADQANLGKAVEGTRRKFSAGVERGVSELTTTVAGVSSGVAAMGKKAANKAEEVAQGARSERLADGSTTLPGAADAHRAADTRDTTTTNAQGAKVTDFGTHTVTTAPTPAAPTYTPPARPTEPRR